MNFWIIQSQENPAEPRSTKGRRLWRSNTLSEVLADRGHSVERWRSSFSHQSKTTLYNHNFYKPHDNYIQRYIYGRPYRRHIGIERYINHLQLASNFQIIARELPTPSLIHVANAPIELMCSVVEFSCSRKCPVIIDVRDLWPDIYIDLIPKRFHCIKPLMTKVLPLFTKNLRSSFAKATGITTLTNSYMQWSLSMCARKKNAFDHVFPMCYPPLNSVSSSTKQEIMRILSLSSQHKIALYLGNIGYQSDFDTLFKAAHILAKSHPDFRIVIAGSGPLEPELSRLSQQHTNVILPGWLNGTQIQALLSIAKFGLISFKPIRNYTYNMPNKFSEYLAGGLAIACGLPGEISSLVTHSGCGFIYDSGDYAMLAKSIASLLDNPPLLDMMCKKSRELHSTSFNSEQVYAQFADFLETTALSF